MTSTLQVSSFITDPSLRTRLWNHLIDVKFKGLYACECSKRASRYARMFSFILATTSIASAATWAILKEYPLVLASIIAVAQVLQIAAPYIRFLKNEKAFLEMSFRYEELYLKYEQLWFKHEREEIRPKALEQRFYKYRQEEIEIERTRPTVVLPKRKRWMNKSFAETEHELELNFAQGEPNNEQPTTTTTTPEA